jgi:hypothetical protein
MNMRRWYKYLECDGPRDETRIQREQEDEWRRNDGRRRNDVEQIGSFYVRLLGSSDLSVVYSEGTNEKMCRARFVK